MNKVNVDFYTAVLSFSLSASFEHVDRAGMFLLIECLEESTVTAAILLADYYTEEERNFFFKITEICDKLLLSNSKSVTQVDKNNLKKLLSLVQKTKDTFMLIAR